VHLFAGEFTEAASLVAQAESVAEATGSSIAPYGALALAVFRGQQAQAASARYPVGGSTVKQEPPHELHSASMRPVTARGRLRGRPKFGPDAGKGVAHHG
jgi:hypothetical protein